MEIAIIGAGIAGLLSAYNLLRKGVNVTIFEKRRYFPRKHCTGVVSKNTLNNMPYANRFVTGKYNTVALYLDLGNKLLQIRIYFNEFAAYKIERVYHELLLLERLKELGASIQSLHNVLEINECCEKVKLSVFQHNSNKVLKLFFDRAVVAEGYPSNLSLKIGCKSTSLPLNALQREFIIKGSYDKNSLYVYINPKYFGFGFAWLVPYGDENAVIGYASEKITPKYLFSHVINKFSRIMDIKIERTLSNFYGGNVLIGYPIKFTSSKRKCICIGDAVAMVKSISGGGLYAITHFANSLYNIMIEYGKTNEKSLHKLSNELMKQYYLKRIIWQAISSSVLKKILSCVTLEKNIIEIRARDIEQFDKHEKILLSKPKFAKV